MAGSTFIGIHASAAVIPVPWNPSGAIPITVYGCPFRRIVWPIAAASPLNRRTQNRRLSTTTGLAPGRPSPAESNTLPTAACTPSTVK